MITVKHLDFAYDTTSLFSDLSLNIHEGNIYGLLGLNGAGKTTLLKLLSGQLFPLGGNILIKDENPVDRHPAFLQELFYVPEEFLLPRMTADQYTNLYAPFYPRFDQSMMDQFLKEFQLDPAVSLHKLSFGQKKKFLLSFALASNTSTVILDEPTNGLDIPSKSQFRKTVASAMSDERTIIISTHQVRDMDQLIDPIIIIHNQKVMLNSTMDELERSFSIHVSDTPLTAEMMPIYCEKSAAGYVTLTKREDCDSHTPLDIEFLFNAVISSPRHFEKFTGVTI
ncbi:MAG: ABC transporter ATP-binding protein [Sphaerochaetaceae bacterium]|nr:ABC transporter ATP-binding protein [Sphaerochaetaceae bacterium]